MNTSQASNSLKRNEYIGEIHLGTCQISSINCCIRTWKAVIRGGKLKPGYWFLRALGIFWKMWSDRITDHLCWDAIEKNMEAIANLAWRAECFTHSVLIRGMSPAVEIWASVMKAWLMLHCNLHQGKLCSTWLCRIVTLRSSGKKSNEKC